jgi:hypothetical protein
LPYLFDYVGQLFNLDLQDVVTWQLPLLGLEKTLCAFQPLAPLCRVGFLRGLLNFPECHREYGRSAPDLAETLRQPARSDLFRGNFVIDVQRPGLEIGKIGDDAVLRGQFDELPAVLFDQLASP